MKQKKRNPFLELMFVLFVIYISLFIAGESGYYENKVNEQITLTEENIKQFEEDVKNNKEIDIQNYVEKEQIDYSCGFSDLGDNVSTFFEKLLTEEFGKVGKVLKKMFS